MANRTRYTANLASEPNLYVDTTTDNIGIGTTVPTSKLHVIGDVLVSGIVTTSSGTLFSGVEIATAGGTVGTGVTLFDFRGPGISTVTVSSGIGTINIEGGGGGSGITTQFKSITIDNPGSAEKIPMFFSPTSITFTKIQSVIGTSAVGSGVTFSIRYGTDISESGTEVVTGGISVGSTTTGVETTSFNNATVPDNNFVWITTSAFSGAPTFLHTTLVF
jgi:hypothetical protein